MAIIPPDVDQTVYDWLVKNFEKSITTISGGVGVSIGPTLNGSVAIDAVAPAARRGAQEVSFPATLTGFEPMKVTTPTAAGRVLLPHPHRYWYSFFEVGVEDKCTDGNGNIPSDQTGPIRLSGVRRWKGRPTIQARHQLG